MQLREPGDYSASYHNHLRMSRDCHAGLSAGCIKREASATHSFLPRQEPLLKILIIYVAFSISSVRLHSRHENKCTIQLLVETTVQCPVTELVGNMPVSTAYYTYNSIMYSERCDFFRSLNHVVPVYQCVRNMFHVRVRFNAPWK